MDLIAPMRTFVRVGELGSFASAADQLNLSPQLVGKHIHALEQHLKVKLINRTTRRQSMTEFGEAYLERARSILADIDDAERLAEAARGKPIGRLRINAPVSFGTRLLAPQLVQYMREHPEVTVDLTLANQLVDIVNDGYDVVFRVGDLADSTLIARRLASYPLVLCASPEYLQLKGEPYHPRELQYHECLGFAHSDLKTRWTFRDHNDQPLSVPIKSKFMVNQSEPLLNACLAGLGIILQPLELVRDALVSGALIEVMPNFPSISPPLNIVYHRDRQITPKIRSFLDFCILRFDDITMLKR